MKVVGVSLQDGEVVVLHWDVTRASGAGDFVGGRLMLTSERILFHPSQHERIWVFGQEAPLNVPRERVAAVGGDRARLWPWGGLRLTMLDGSVELFGGVRRPGNVAKRLRLELGLAHQG